MKFSNFDPRKFILGVAPKILKPVLDTPFQGLLLGKVWTTPTNLGSQRLGVGWSPKNFNEDMPPNFGPFFKITPISDLLNYKGCLYIERPQRFGGEREKKKETSVEK